MEENNDNLITIKKSSLKAALGKLLSQIFKIYIKINHMTTIIFKKIFSSSETMQKLLSSDAIVLFLNTLLFSFIGNIFRGLIGEIAFIVCFLNICAFLFNKMGWIEALNKK